jgi:16S rRNA (adenine1518-N6/adenine1519-N6)-dimethyltransferase
MQTFDPAKPTDIKAMLDFDVAKKSLGQHFLTDKSVVEKMVKTAKIGLADSIFEIGPGLGVLTKQIIKASPKKLIACELDRKLFSILQNQYSSNIKLVNQNALTLIPELVVNKPFKVVSNLPYNISSSSIISLLTICPTLPEKIVVMVQKEVAERIIAPPHDSNRGILTVFVELLGEAKITQKVSAGLFYPPPQVESAVLLIDNIKEFGLPRLKVFKLIKMAFSKKRKKIKNSLFASLQILPDKANEIAEKSNISLESRPEELTKDQWFKLLTILIKHSTEQTIKNGSADNFV